MWQADTVMSTSRTPDSDRQRNALAPSLLGAAALFLSPVLFLTEWFVIVLFVVSILALIVTWFAIQARHWWWIPVFLAIAVIWNPVYPFSLSGLWLSVAPFVAGVAFIAAGALITTRRQTGS